MNGKSEIEIRKLVFVSPGEARGAIIILLVSATIIFLMLVSIVVNTGFSRVIDAEIQAAADAAALAGATALCSSKRCYADARKVAIETLNQHIVRGSGLRPYPIGVDETEEGSEWVDGPLRVVVQRGRWWPRGFPPSDEGEPRFEEIDVMPGGTATWQAAHPGVPYFMVANAVKVTIERGEIDWAILSPGEQQNGAAAEAIAISGELGVVNVAPFALPVCSLLDETTDFSARVACSKHRLFAQADRYCVDPDDNDDCNVLPDAIYHWRQLGSCYWDKGYYCGVSGSCRDDDIDCPFPSPVRHENSCGWNGDLRFSQVSDHFGVVGRPAASGVIPTEAELRGAISAEGDSALAAEIGDTFRILAEGFREPETQNLLADLLRHPANGERFVPMEGMGWRSETWDPPGASGECGCLDPTRGTPLCRERGEEDNSHAPEGPLYYAHDSDDMNAWHSGLCNTLRPSLIWRVDGERWRGNPDSCAKINSGVHSGPAPSNDRGSRPDQDSGPDPEASPETPTIRGSYWKISVPVIADPRSDAWSCNSLGDPGARKDPKIDPALDYTIIGFVTMRFMDVDIGQEAPSMPPMDDIPPLVKYGDGYGCQPDGWPEDLWGFRGPGGTTQCNMMRAYTTCDTRIIPSSQNKGRPSTRLVR